MHMACTCLSTGARMANATATLGVDVAEFTTGPGGCGGHGRRQGGFV